MACLEFIKSIGFEGPHDYNTVVNKNNFSENTTSFCDKVPFFLKETKNAYFLTDVNLFETKNVKSQIKCMNAVIESVYGINKKEQTIKP